MSNLVSEDVGDRLSAAYYLHSNTENFVKISQHIQVNSLRIGNNKLELTLILLGNIIDTLNSDINRMYKSVGITAEDTCKHNLGSLISYIPAGARAFLDKFLNKNLFQKEESSNKKIDSMGYYMDNGLLYTAAGTPVSPGEYKGNLLMKIVNSPVSLSKLDELSKNIEINFKLLDTKIDSKLMEVLGITLDRTSELINNSIVATLDKQIEDLFTGEPGTKKRVRMKSRTVKGKTIENVKDIEDLLNILKINPDEISMTKKKDVELIKAAIKTLLIRRKQYNTLGRIYYDKYIEPTYIQMSGSWAKPTDSIYHLSKEDRSLFTRKFSLVVKDYSVLDFSSKNDSIKKSSVGFALEFGFYINLLMSGKMVDVIGQDLERRYLRDYRREHGKTKDDSRKNPLVLSASDIIIKGNGKEEFRLLLKNNFNEESSVLSFRALPTIKLSTFINNAVEDELTKDILAYLLINTAYLSKYGLTKYLRGNVLDDKLKIKEIPRLQQYILLLLVSAYNYILGSEYKVEVKKDKIISLKGNIGYIYLGKYLIPVAAFFVSAYALLWRLVKYYKTYNKSAIGGLSMPTFEGLDLKTDGNEELISKGITNISMINNRAFLRRKIALIRLLRMKNELPKGISYPQELVDYGSEYGENVFNDLKFRLRITLMIDKIQNLLML